MMKPTPLESRSPSSSAIRNARPAASATLAPVGISARPTMWSASSRMTALVCVDPTSTPAVCITLSSPSDQGGCAPDSARVETFEERVDTVLQLGFRNDALVHHIRFDVQAEHVATFQHGPSRRALPVHRIG